jgi:choline kinase
MDEDGLVKELGKKPASFNDIQGQYTGLIKIKAGRIPEMIDFYERLDKQAIYDGKQFDQMYMTSFLQLLINAGWKIKAIPVKNGWLEVDSVDDLKLYEQLYASGDLSEFFSINL